MGRNGPDPLEVSGRGTDRVNWFFLFAGEICEKMLRPYVLSPYGRSFYHEVFTTKFLPRSFYHEVFTTESTKEPQKHTEKKEEKGSERLLTRISRKTRKNANEIFEKF